MDAWQQWMLDSDSELEFNGFCEQGFWSERIICGSIGLRLLCGISDWDVNDDSCDTDSASVAICLTATLR